MIVIARNFGQLGNRLFLYGHFIAAAEEYGVPLANPCFAEYAHLFPSTASDLWCRYPVTPPDDQTPNDGRTRKGVQTPSMWRRRYLSKCVYLATRGLSIAGLGRGPIRVIRIKGDEKCDLGDHEFAAACWSGHVLTQGWLFRSERLFQKHADKVRDHFRIGDAHQENVDGLIGRLREVSDVVVGVHVRHGDYATFMEGQYFFTITEYVDMMRGIVEQLSPRRVGFLVCSDGELDLRDFAGLRVRFGSGKVIEDLYALAEVDILLGPPSTFSGWASFYGDVPMVMIESGDEWIDVRSLVPPAEGRVA